MFEKLLVANRGEIAIRIMRSAQELGVRTVAIYEETDKAALHIRKADEAICIGSGPRKDYLSIERIIHAATTTGADAIHPGYGFLAENPLFSKECTDAGLVFVGPPPGCHPGHGEQGDCPADHDCGGNSGDPRHRGARVRRCR